MAILMTIVIFVLLGLILVVSVTIATVNNQIANTRDMKNWIFTLVQCINDNAKDIENIQKNQTRNEKLIDDNRESCNANIVSICNLSNDVTRQKFQYIKDRKESKNGSSN